MNEESIYSDDNIMESLAKVPLSKFEDAIESIKKHTQDRDPDSIYITFEYIIGSFYPDIYKNILDKIKDAYTKGFADGIKYSSEIE